MANKNIALEKIESHEKLCRIMQKQTHDKNETVREPDNKSRENFTCVYGCCYDWYGWRDNCVN